MKTPRSIFLARKAALPLCVMGAAMLVHGQSTTITTGNTVLQSPVKRFGINLGQQTSYDSGQIMKNLLYSNPGFEGGLYQSVIRCASGTTTVCNDDDSFSGWGSGFWNGATFEFIYGAAQGQKGTISFYTAANGSVGGVFGLSGSSLAPGAGDYMIVRKNFPGNPAAGWATTLTGLGSVSANNTDLPSGTQGIQTVAVTAPTASDHVILTNYFDGTPNASFVQLNGTYVLSFRAKGVFGNMSVAVNLKRYNGAVFLNQTVNLTNNWATYNLSFGGTEVGTAVGTVQLTFTVDGPNVVNIDDVSLAQANSDPTNTTVFRDPVVNALKQLNPGVIRFWGSQLGQSLDNFIAPPFGRQRSGYSAFATESVYVSYNLPEFLQLCQAVGAEPWIVVPTTFSTAEASNLIDFLSGSSSTTYGAKRAALGQTAPWTSVFSKIHLEFGNEAWNAGFKGGSIEFAQPYGQRAQAIFAAMRANSSYVASSFDLVLGGQATSPGRNQGIQDNCNNNDTFAIAPYMMNQVDNYSSIEDLFGSTFAEAEAFQTSSGTAEGIANGLMLQNSQFLAASANPKPLVTYEFNLSTLAGSITQTALDSYASSTGAGLAVVDSMLQQLRQGVLTQNMFALTQYIDGRQDGKSVYLWGSVVDMGVSDRRRPQFLAMQLANQAIGNNAVMLATNQTGANPTWNQSSANSVQLNNAHYLQSFAFLGSNGYSLVVFNLNRFSSLPVTFAGANVPNGAVTIRQLTSLNITDTNETANLVVPTTQTVFSFSSANPVTLPPYSMTVYTWAAPGNPVPLISNVTVSSVTSFGATISWTTNQPTSAQVAYGTTQSYGTMSTLNQVLTTNHTVILGGLTPGTAYNFAGISTNSNAVTSTSDNFTFTTTSLPAPQITAVAATSITNTGAVITWTTDQPSTSQVQYGATTAYGSQTAVDNALVTAHSVAITGLTQSTSYNFSAISANASGSSASSFNSAFTTLITPAVISNVTATQIGSNSVTITWNTDQPTTTQVEFGLTTAYGTYSQASNSLVNSHSVSFGNLTPGTTYNYVALSTNSSGVLSTSANNTFTTLAPAPVLTLLAVSGITTTTATVTWTTDQPSTSQVAFGTTTSYGANSAFNSALSTSHSVALTNLTPATVYFIQPISINGQNVTGTASGNLTTATAPTVISNLTASSITTGGAIITWTTDQPATSQVQFGTTTSYGSLSTANGSLVTTHSVSVQGLQPGTLYNYSALSTNFFGSLTTSPNATFTTPGNPTQATISAVTATQITPTTATITWTTDQPATSQLEFGLTSLYGVFSTADSTLVTSHSVTLTNLTPGTLYNYAALSTNSTAMLTTSANFTFTTPTGGNPAPVISSVAATGVTNTSATITWTTDLASTSQVAFGLTPAYGSLSTADGNLVTTHSVTITGLTPSMTYNFSALSASNLGVVGTSGNFTFTTSAGPVPVLSSNVIATSISITSAIVTWTTDQPSTSQVEFGTTPALGAFSTASSSLTTSHTVFLNGLTATTPYYYAVLSANSAGTVSTSATLTFNTTASGAPVISAVVTNPITANSATITWTTDIPSTSQLNYGATTAYGSQSTLNSSLVTNHSVTLTGLNSGALYNFDVVSTGAAAVTAITPNYSFVTTSVGQPPVISAVSVSNITTTSATITWTTDVPSSSLLSYGTTTAYGLQSTLDSTLVTSHAVNLTGLTPGGTYNFQVTSAIAAGATANSANATFSVLASPAPVISSVAAWPVENTTASILWTTDQNATSQVRYGTTTSYGSVGSVSGLAIYHVVPLSNLIPGTTYNFQVVTASSAGSTATSGNNTFTTGGAPPPAISGVTVSAVTGNSATITWTTDQPSTTQVSYGTTSAYGLQSTLNPGLSTTHSVTLTGLTAGTTYNYAALSANSVGTTGTSANFQFSTTGSPAPVISAVSATSITATSATITWTTNQASTSQVSYGTTTAYGSQSALNSTLLTTHSVTLTGLTQGTTYNYAAISGYATGTPTTSANFTFTTLTSPPVISAVTATSVSSTSTTITWTTDQPSTSQVNYGTTTAYGLQSALNGALVTAHSVTLTGLAQNTTYNFDVVSGYATGTPATSGNFTFTTGQSAPVISAVTATSITATSATITWTTDQASTSQVSYGTTTAYGSQSALNSTLLTTHSVTLTGLSQGTIYNYAAISGYATGTPAASANFTFTTLQNPPVISAVTATPVTSTSTTITWTTDQPSSSLVNYGATSSYGLQSTLNSALVTSHSVTLTGLTQNTTYNFDVVSGYATGTPTTSGNFTFTTGQTLPVISAVTATSITANSATIMWTTDQASTSQVSYGTTTAYGSQSALNSALLTTHTVTLTGLSQGTTYNYAAISGYATGTPTTSTNFTFATLQNPPVISAVTATSITANSATITWTTDQASTSLVNYGTTTSYGSQSALNSSLLTTHSVTLTGLTQNTTYNFDVVSGYATGTPATSGNFSFTTAQTPPVISAVTATSITGTSATITWTTNQASTSQVSYGTTTAYGSQSALNSTLLTTHSVTLTGLTQGTTYNYAAISGYATGTPTTSANFTFATLQSPPVISAVTATSVTSNSATITWTTDQASTSQVSYGTTPAYGSQSALNSALVTAHSVTIGGLTIGTTYNFAVSSGYATGTPATSGNFTFTTLSAPAPVISSVASFPVANTTATILWTTDVNSTSQVNYGTTAAYGSQTPLITTLGLYHNVPLSNLIPGTTYHYQVISTNAAGATSTSGDFSFATSGTAPVVFTNVTATGLTSNSATVTWTTNLASSSQVYYGTTISYGTLSTLNSSLVTSHSVTLTGLAPGTTYNYEVLSNTATLSGVSTNFTFTTPSGPVPVISAVTATSITSTSATITWTTDQATSSLVNYGTTPAYGSQSALNPTLLTSHSVTLTGLTAGTTYNFDVVSVNAANTSATSGNSTFSTTAAPAPVISAVTATSITSTSATISWTTDQASTSLVNYGTTPGYGSQSALNPSLVTAHSVTLTGLTPGTTYNFDVVSANASSTSATSSNSTFSTTAAPAPVISAVTATSITSTSATITWTTDQGSTSLVNYGTTPAYGSQSALNSSLVTFHSVTLTGLTAGMTYNFDVVSANASSTSATSGNFTFSTTAAAAPVITSVTATSITTTSATITWTTDQASTSLVNYGTTTAYGSQSALNSSLVTSHSVTLTGLTAGTAYNFDVVSANASSTSSTSANFTFSTTAVAPVISAVTATSITTTSATITWTTNQASTSLVNYGTTTAYGSQSALNSSLVTSHSVTLTGLTAGTTYNFDVVSANASSISSTSANFTFSTTAAAAPVISAVTSSSITTTSATITWTTDQASTSLVNYGTTTAYGSQSALNPALLTSHSVTLTGLTAGTAYNFDVVSTNASNTTSTSGNFTFSTSSASTPGPVLSSVAAYPVANTTATILWTTDQNSTSVVNYGTTTAYGQQTSLGAATTIYHAVNLTGLTPGTTYNFQVVSTNSSSVSSSSGNFSFTTSGTAPAAGPVITAVTATGITNTSVTINWTTNQLSNSQVSYGLTNAYGSLSALNTNLVTSHTVTLTGLTPGTTYNYQVLSTNGSAISASSGNFTFLTTGSVPAPIVSSVAFWGVTGSSVIMSWSTDQLANTYVTYGTTPALGQSSAVQTALVTSHGATLTGLQPNTTYYFAANSTNSAGTNGSSAQFSFTTLDSGAPVVLTQTPTPSAGNTASVAWTLSKAGTCQVEFGPDTSYGRWSQLTTALQTALGYVPSGTIHYRIHCMDSTGAASVTTDLTFIEP